MEVTPINYRIEYACICSLGRMRRNNEDNFYCDGHIREDIYSNDETELCGAVTADEKRLFAVFDGMGGEACGEVAAYIAASNLEQCSRECTADAPGELAAMLDLKVREETEKRSLVLMGSTAAVLQISGCEFRAVNTGDSRIYRLGENGLEQISKDHIMPVHRANAITEFLGMPEGKILCPYTTHGATKIGELFLLCSDGVTDMLSDSEIEGMLSSDVPVSGICRSIVDLALDRGGTDNITAVVLKIAG